MKSINFTSFFYCRIVFFRTYIQCIIHNWCHNQAFLFWARSENPEKSEIPGIGIGIWKFQKILRNSRKNPEWKIWVSGFSSSGFVFLVLGFQSLGFGIFIPWISQYSRNFSFSGYSGEFYPRDHFLRGISRQKPNSGHWWSRLSKKSHKISNSFSVYQEWVS